ncbi:hypothetical protein K1X22_21785 [Mycolicibacterium farcinogenes]|uniref:hypothetical protein n=1 Tax=Mycolicibacterium farcinogenes TaxID=1802 RepID=UPI001C8EC3D0|nr:hypothetical protein [Mycolicibacterium farcinogenes]QZH58861.1 hypothetical protein K1X22_21785 [Mycolicibacterium farcinogenes]
MFVAARIRRWRNSFRVWNRYAYLSAHERRLNRFLWLVLLAGLVYSVLQHVVLAEVAPVFRGGERWGDLIYDLAIAYIGAFVFYLLVVRIPLRQDRRNVCENLGPLIDMVIGEATNLMGLLNRAAGAPMNRVCTADNVADTCSRISPDTLAEGLAITSPDGSYRIATVREAVRQSMTRTQRLNHELLEFSSYLSSDLINSIIGIEQRGYFGLFEELDKVALNRANLNDLSILWRHLFDYLQIVDQVERYYEQFFPAFRFNGRFLIAGTHEGSDAIPLAGRMDG